MAVKKGFPQGLEYAWICTSLGTDVFARYQPLAEGEQVAHIEHKAFIFGKPVERKSYISPSHRTFTRAELNHMVESGKDSIGLNLNGSFERAVHNAIGKFETLDAEKAAAVPVEPIQFHVVEGDRREQPAPVLKRVLVA